MFEFSIIKDTAASIKFKNTLQLYDFSGTMLTVQNNCVSHQACTLINLIIIATLLLIDNSRP